MTNSLDQIPSHTNDGKQIILHAREMIDLEIEIISWHPNLCVELTKTLQENNYEKDIFYGVIAAYCDIILDGNYDELELVTKLQQELLKKRGVINVQMKEIGDTVPTTRPIFDDSEGRN